MTRVSSFCLASALSALTLLAGCERPDATGAVTGATLAEEKGCVACHGINGKAKAPIYPHLNGQWPSYLRTQLRKYRNGERINAIMNSQTAALTDHDIDALAAHYAAQ